MSHKVLFVCFLDIFILLLGLIGRKIAIWEGKIEQESQMPKRRFVERLRKRATEK